MTHLAFTDRIRLPGSARHLAVVRIVFCVHVLTVLTSPANAMMYRLQAGYLPWSNTIFPSGLENLIADHLDRPLLDLGIVAALMGAFGFATRVVIPILFLCFVATQNLWFRCSLFHDDWLYFVFFLLVLSFARCGDALAIDSWLARRRHRINTLDPQNYRWPVELMILWF